MTPEYVECEDFEYVVSVLEKRIDKLKDRVEILEESRKRNERQ